MPGVGCESIVPYRLNGKSHICLFLLAWKHWVVKIRQFGGSLFCDLKVTSGENDARVHALYRPSANSNNSHQQPTANNPQPTTHSQQPSNPSAATTIRRTTTGWRGERPKPQQQQPNHQPTSQPASQPASQPNPAQDPAQASQEPSNSPEPPPDRPTDQNNLAIEDRQRELGGPSQP